MAIRTVSTTFTLASFRHLKQFVGAITAAVAANEVALRYGIDHAATLNEPDPWSVMGSQYQIKINGIRSDTIATMSARMHVVSLYSGFDGFVSSVRREWQEFSGRPWKKEKPKDKKEADDYGPIKEFLENAPIQKNEFYAVVNKSIECGIEHYRKVRNAIVHPSEQARKKSDTFYNDNEAQLRELGQSYGFKEAPHSLLRLDFHDAKLLAQLILDAGKRVSCAFDPGDEAIANSLPTELKNNRRGNAERYHNRIHCFVRTKYGLSEERANRVIAIIQAC